jgi:hypothetical protein
MSENKRTLTELPPTGLQVAKRRMPMPARDKVSPRVIAALARNFKQHGESAIDALRQNNPATYMRLVAALLPKDAPPPSRPLEGFTNEELAEALAALKSLVGGRDDQGGAGDAGDE